MDLPTARLDQLAAVHQCVLRADMHELLRLQFQVRRMHAVQAFGGARMVLANGVLHDFPLLATVNRALRLSEGDGQDTRFDELSASLAITRGAATTDDLVIQAGHLRAVLSGQIGFDRSLNLRGRAIVSAERVAAGVDSVHELARLRKGGEIVVPLTITGSLDAPKFEVDVGSVIREGVVDELKRRLRRLIK